MAKTEKARRGDFEIEECEVELTHEQEKKFQEEVEAADKHLADCRVNFRWHKEPLELVKKVAAQIGVPYQTYMKQAVYQQALADWERMNGASKVKHSMDAASDDMVREMLKLIVDRLGAPSSAPSLQERPSYYVSQFPSLCSSPRKIGSLIIGGGRRTVSIMTAPRHSLNYGYEVVTPMVAAEPCDLTWAIEPHNHYFTTQKDDTK